MVGVLNLLLSLMATNRVWEKILLSAITMLELLPPKVVSHVQFEAILKKINVKNLTSLKFHSLSGYPATKVPSTVTFDMLSKLCNLTKLDIFSPGS